MTEIWHNPRCSKSRQTLALLEERGIALKVRPYLNTPPNEAELRDVLAALGTDAHGLARKNEKTFRELGLAEADNDTLLAAMVEHPILIERPIVVHEGKARIGRPPEAVLDLF